MKLLDFHRNLLSDETGQEAFRKALFETIRGGAIVLDLGTGTGIHALFACLAGAKRVYAVDQHEVIELAQALCRANGYADRICFLRKPAAEAGLTEPVDVIVAHHGLPGLFTLLIEARDRFLKKGGVLIPASVELFCAPLEAPNAYKEKVEFWGMPHFDLTFAPARSVAINSMHDWRIDPKELLGESVHLACYDFLQVEKPKLSETVETRIDRPGVLHGIGLWYVEWLTKGISLSAAPSSTLPSSLWKNGFLPVATPVPVEPGDVVKLRIQTGPAGWWSLWSWEVAVHARQGGEKARLIHSTFSGWLFSKDVLRKQALDHAPHLTPRGAAVRFVLEACDAGRLLRSIEQEVFQRFPDLFRDPGEAAGFVAEIIARYAV